MDEEDVVIGTTEEDVELIAAEEEVEEGMTEDEVVEEITAEEEVLAFRKLAKKDQLEMQVGQGVANIQLTSHGRIGRCRDETEVVRIFTLYPIFFGWLSDLEFLVSIETSICFSLIVLATFLHSRVANTSAKLVWVTSALAGHRQALVLMFPAPVIIILSDHNPSTTTFCTALHSTQGAKPSAANCRAVRALGSYQLTCQLLTARY